MKILRFIPKTRGYSLIRDVGEMRPFSEQSLLIQIKNCIELIPKKENLPYVVFSEEDLVQVLNLLRLVGGGTRFDQGHGHGMSGEDLILFDLLQKSGFVQVFIPADMKGNQPVVEVKKWLIGFTSPIVLQRVRDLSKV